MTDEALKLLNWIVRHAPVTHKRLTHQCNDYERRLRRQVLAELMTTGRVVRVHGWYVPAGQTGSVLTVSIKQPPDE